MQGVFETHATENLISHETTEETECPSDDNAIDRTARYNRDKTMNSSTRLQEEAAHQQGSGDGCGALPKRVRLDAIANVPWSNLTPANDRETQRQMREHRIRQVQYESLTDERKQYIPKVNPYPEAPDCVFPGTPCYRITYNGFTRVIFVIDPASPEYDPGWDGKCRRQSTGRWIVPHFIFRDDDAVALAKSKWETVYDLNARAGNPTGNKTDYDSQILALGPPAGAPLFPPGVVGPGIQHECYYVEGTPNPALDAPEIQDPLFKTTFNANPRFLGGRRIRPFPYHQDRNVFPQRPAPPPVFVLPVPPAAPGRGGAGPGRGGAGAPGGAGAGRGGAAPVGGRGRGVLQQIPPHQTLLQVEPSQNLTRGRSNVDWINLTPNTLNIEISTDELRAACEQAEASDYAFALNMQGLRGTNLSAVWTCTDPDYDVTDRSVVMAQFVRTYMEKFYQHVSVTSATDVEDVVHEALRMHEEFCKGWVTRHHRTLSSEISAAADALVGLFMHDLKPILPPGLNITRSHMSRYFRRHPDYCGEFAHCLYHYMTSTEHMRGNRNPSYKAMNNERTAHITALKQMGSMIFAPENQNKTKNYLQGLTQDTLIFDTLFIDWHLVAAQMPQHHKEFDGYANNFSLFRSRTGGRGNPFPPWQQMRRV